jgi:hypothetical protein
MVQDMLVWLDMHRVSTFIGAGLSSFLLAAPGAARECDAYAAAAVGPAYFHNDDVSGRDTSGFGVAAQLDLGTCVTRWLVLHARLIADHSGAMTFDASNGGEDYVTTVLGLGLGATANWRRWRLGVATGAQFTWHADALNPNDGPTGAGLGPFVGVDAGYAFLAFDAMQLGMHALARYRVGKDDVDPSGYQLGLALSVAHADEPSMDEAEAHPAARVARTPAPASEVTLAAQMGWWNAEIELLAGDHFFAAVGGPWAATLLGLSEDRLILPFGARVGYQLDLSRSWKLRAGTHLVGLYGAGAQCLDCASREYGTESWQLFELGVRHDSHEGLVYGVDVPFFAINDVLGLNNDTGFRDTFYAPPISFVFVQIYAGYAWAL